MIVGRVADGRPHPDSSTSTRDGLALPPSERRVEVGLHRVRHVLHGRVLRLP